MRCVHHCQQCRARKISCVYKETSRVFQVWKIIFMRIYLCKGLLLFVSVCVLCACSYASAGPFFPEGSKKGPSGKRQNLLRYLFLKTCKCCPFCGLQRQPTALVPCADSQPSNFQDSSPKFKVVSEGEKL